MQFKSIIFGISGQDGQYLKIKLEKLDHFVIGVSRTTGNFVGDVSDFEYVKKLISETQPDYIFHFAATSNTSHDALFENNASISNGTINILEVVRLFSPSSKVFLSGSAMQFENNGLPISENTPFTPSSPYSISRIHSVLNARYYRNKFNLKIYIGYLFNHDSPYRTEHHINQKIIKSLQRIKNGCEQNIYIGNVDVRKEFNFAQDIVNAIWLLVNQEEVFEVVIGSGITFSIRDWLKICFELEGLDYSKYLVCDNTYKSEYDELISDPSLIKSLGWSPLVGINELAKIMLNSSV